MNCIPAPWLSTQDLTPNLPQKPISGQLPHSHIYPKGEELQQTFTFLHVCQTQHKHPLSHNRTPPPDNRQFPGNIRNKKLWAQAEVYPSTASRRLLANSFRVFFQIIRCYEDAVTGNTSISEVLEITSNENLLPISKLIATVDRVRYKLAVPVYRCLHHKAPKLPDSLLCRCLGYRWSSSTALSTPSPAGCTALSKNNTRPSGVLCH